MTNLFHITKAVNEVIEAYELYAKEVSYHVDSFKMGLISPFDLEKKLGQERKNLKKNFVHTFEGFKVEEEEDKILCMKIAEILYFERIK